jgi:DNA polymerase, archaea type
MDMTLQALIFGHSDQSGLVALEPATGKADADDMRLFLRRDGGTVQEQEPFKPFLWLAEEALLQGCTERFEIESLAGSNPLKWLVRLPSWKEFQKLADGLKKKTGQGPADPAAPYFLLNDPVQQFLMATGRTLFKGVSFGDLRRLQVDIETYTEGAYEFCNADRPGDRIVAIALADQTGWTEVLSGAEFDEKALIERFVLRVREKDPDVIEGHNLFKFDLPYLAARARLHRVKLALGRDGSAPAVRASRFSIADRTISYPRAEISGRHVVDTYFLAQAYDVSHRALEGLGLKEVAAHFGVAAPNRVYLEGTEIAHVFDKDPSRLMEYARHDIVETRAISDLLSPTYFAQAQILPFSYQNVCVRGNSAKIDALMLRNYLRQHHSVPQPDAPREFAGGYTDIFFTGLARNVHHCDIRSLYPSILLSRKWKPARDELGTFLQLLAYLRDLRIEAKQSLQTSSSDEERHHYEALQSTFKILINSFYGYLGFSQARFSDFEIAERVTAEGRSILTQMIEWIRRHGGQPIEIDTDGVYFIPPITIDPFRDGLRKSLPPGIEVEFDGEYAAMFSYKMKNYALLDEQGEIIIKGAALKSRGLEPFQREFLEDCLRLKLGDREGEIPALLARYRGAIERREWPIRKLAKTETLQDAPATYQAKIAKGGRGRNAAYELALRSGRDYRAGDLVSYYITGDKTRVPAHAAAKLVSEWDPVHRDENVPYYLAKLDALGRKFDAIPAPDDGHPELDFGGEES